MTWYKDNQKVIGHKCQQPPPIFHSTVPMAYTDKWQCPECYTVYGAEHEWRFRESNDTHGHLFIEHKLGDNDYWYFFVLEGQD